VPWAPVLAPTPPIRCGQLRCPYPCWLLRQGVHQFRNPRQSRWDRPLVEASRFRHPRRLGTMLRALFQGRDERSYSTFPLQRRLVGPNSTVKSDVGGILKNWTCWDTFLASL